MHADRQLDQCVAQPIGRGLLRVVAVVEVPDDESHEPVEVRSQTAVEYLTPGLVLDGSERTLVTGRRRSTAA